MLLMQDVKTGRFVRLEPREIQELGYGLSLVEMTTGECHLIDTAQEYLVSEYSWYQNEKGYAATWNEGNVLLIHRLITGALPDTVVDHKNHKAWDSRQANLRVCSHAENMRNRSLNKNNTSGFKGVSWYKRRSRWVAHVAVNNKKKTVGYFHTTIEAARAYDRAALELHGAFACTNVMLGLLPPLHPDKK